MVVDGKQIADAIQRELEEQLRSRTSQLVGPLRLAVVFVGADPISDRFIKRKRTFGEKVDVAVDVHQFPRSLSEEKLKKEVTNIVEDKSVTGVIVQLPLPEHIDTQGILKLIPPEKDVDALSPSPRVMPPVAAAVAEIIERHAVAVRGKKFVVVGRGKLVGTPVAEWARSHGAEVEVIGRDTENRDALLKEADLVVTGAGVPRLVKPDMVKEGVVLIDAGTSEQGNELVGDIDPLCAKKSSLFSPVPGGVGPVTIAMLFKNLLTLVDASQGEE